MSDAITKEESARRLLVLAEFLAKLPPQVFDYSSWATSEDLDHAPYKLLNEDGQVRVPEGFCGTTACALGWAACIPEFNDLGLVIENYGNTKCPNFAIVDKETDCREEEAGMRVFGLTSKEADFLFYPSTRFCIDYFPEVYASYGEAHRSDPDHFGPKDSASAIEVAEHIRRFVKNHRS